MNTHGRKLEIFCDRSPWNDKVKFFLRETKWTPDRTTVSVGLPITHRELTADDLGQNMPETFHMPEGDAQKFMDELWRVGFRPTEGTGSAGSLAATEKHLNDMRALVAKAHDVPLK